MKRKQRKDTQELVRPTVDNPTYMWYVEFYHEGYRMHISDQTAAVWPPGGASFKRFGKSDGVNIPSTPPTLKELRWLADLMLKKARALYEKGKGQAQARAKKQR